MDLMTREEFERTMVPLANGVARRVNQPLLSKREIDDVYARYIRGNGSLFAFHDNEEQA